MSSNTTLPLTTAAATLRRVSHGNIRFQTEARQPQDGAIHSAAVAALSPRNFPLVAAEPDDARLTGMTRSLNRRLIGLNVRPLEAAPRQRPARVAIAAATARQVA